MALLNDEYQSAICREVRMAAEAWGALVAMHSAPSAIWRPMLSVDGNQWCALYGDNLQDGVAGFGDSPEAAMRDFDNAWRAALKPQHATKGVPEEPQE